MSSSTSRGRHDHVARAIGPTHAQYTPPGGPGRPTPSDEHALLHELWQISHFGWIPEATIRRSLTIGGVQEIPAAALAERLSQLVEHGSVEQRHSDAGAGAGEREWRLTDTGRNALSC